MDPLPELRAFLDSLDAPHILFDARYRIVAANTAYQRQFGTAAEVLGKTCYAVSHHFDVPCDQAGESCPLAMARASGQRERVLHLHHTPKGEEYVNIELTPLTDARGRQAYFIEKMEVLPLAQGRAQPKGLVGRAPAFRQMLALLARVAPSKASVLLQGESGTGKEMLAQALHEASPRRDKPLVAVDCASLPENLFESELFGHERGAFTGAAQARVGLVEAAAGGTLFIDEVGDIPLAMQVKLLRLLETGTYRRVGSSELRYADIRVVSATHRDLDAMVAEGSFREDLYYRLCSFPIRVPPLRERVEDIALLCTTLLARVAPQRKLTLSDAALERLQQHDFPGNVRELRNLLERASLLCDGDSIHLRHVQQALQTGLRRAPHTGGAPRPAGDASGRALKAAEQQAFAELVAQHRGSRAELAAALGISERSLYRKLRAGRDAD